MSNAKKKRVSLRGSKGTIQRVLKLIQPYRGLVLFTLLLAAVTVLTTLYAPILSGRGVDLIVGQGNVNFPALGKIAIQFGVTVCVTSICQWLMNMVNNRITFQVVRDIRVQAFQHMEILPLSYMDAHKPGDAISRINTDVEQFSDGLLMGFTQLFTGILTIVGTLGFMLSIDWRITLIVVVLTPLSIFVAKFIAEHTYDMFRVQSETRAELTGLVDELIGNEHLVRAFGDESRAEERFDKINADLQICGVKATFFSSITNPSTRFVNSLVYTGVGVTGALAAISGRMTVGQLTPFLNYANQYTKPFNEISGVVTELQNAIACAGRVFELIEEEPQVPEPADATALTDVEGRVDLEHVAFSYRPDQKLIEDLNLAVKPGERVAIVGPTGCGKTTVINLLMRFYDVDAGSISVEGDDIRQVTRKSLRSSYGMVLQDTWLRSGTVRENILIGKPDATEEEMIEAAKNSHAHSFIKRLPKGYDTVIGEDGGGLSQGQKQLLCITRLMLCRPPMLILDEATSSIDTRTEMKIQNAFARLMEGHTSFIVAHRLSTIREADVILVMKDGHIIEQGNHESLLAKKEFYAKLYNSQFKD